MPRVAFLRSAIDASYVEFDNKARSMTEGVGTCDGTGTATFLGALPRIGTRHMETNAARVWLGYIIVKRG